MITKITVNYNVGLLEEDQVENQADIPEELALATVDCLKRLSFLYGVNRDNGDEGWVEDMVQEHCPELTK